METKSFVFFFFVAHICTKNAHQKMLAGEMKLDVSFMVIF